ncbi:MAG TPA: CpaF family protein, partial [Phenylobacterium sp.]|nr:CpaF family protein [Phenylobacterium sp.]
MFGKRSTDGPPAPKPQAPPPAPAAGAPIATRPQRVEAPAAAAAPKAAPQSAGAALADRATASQNATSSPKMTQGFEQLRAAQSGGATQVVREQSDYYHATKTTIFNALINTIDLAQLAQLDAKTAAEEIRDIVAELVAI